MAKLRVDPGEELGGAVVAEISREVVRLHAHFYGRGPTKAKSIWRSEVVVVILEEVFTKAELVLVEAGRFKQVRAHRQAVQDQIEPLLRRVVEEATGRPVRAFLSQVSAEDRGIASEVFVLGAAAEPGERDDLPA